jgi:hypothetical protein
MNKLDEQQIFDFLRKIENFEILLTCDREPQYVYCGVITYVATNGWEIRIFNDCNEWDYIESVKSNNGQSLYYDDMSDSLGNYRTSEEIQWKAYGLPGYLEHKDEIWWGYKINK